MGRYYEGDIEGKFWFGVQSSTDAEFFGAHEDKSFISYVIPDDVQKDMLPDGIDKCIFELGNWKERLDQFFDDNKGYNDEMMIKYWKEKYDEDINSDAIRRQLEWYARLSLGRDIEEFFKENPNSYCYFEAEL